MAINLSDSPIFRDLPALTDLQQTRRAEPKAGKPVVLARKERKQSREQQAEAFRKAVWERDGGKSRATGKKLVKSGTTEWAHLGEVDHVINRSTAPDRIYDVSNGILLSKEENRLKKAACPGAPEHHFFEIEGPDDRTLPQVFVWRKADGTVIRRSKPR